MQWEISWISPYDSIRQFTGKALKTTDLREEVKENK